MRREVSRARKKEEMRRRTLQPEHLGLAKASSLLQPRPQRIALGLTLLDFLPMLRLLLLQTLQPTPNLEAPLLQLLQLLGLLGDRSMHAR